MGVGILLSLLLGASAQAAAPAPPKQPVYIYLFSRINDHMNLDLSEERILRTLPVLERYRSRHPLYNVAALYQFSGNVSQALDERNRANGLRDRLLDLARRGVAEIGYDGTEEPTYLTRPRPNFRKAKTAEDRWLARGEAAEWFLTEYKHFLTGQPDPTKSGGLKKLQEVFGEAAFIGGVTEELGGDAEAVHQIRRMNSGAMMPGLPEPQTYPARNLHGYAGSVAGIGKIMSPEPDFAPELFWQDSVLRCSDTSGPSVKVVPAHSGPEALKAVLDGLDRSRPHVIRVQLGQQELDLDPAFAKALLSSTVRWVYDNPKPAHLPPNALRPRPEVDAAYGREEEVVKWLVEEFFPANPGSRFVLSADLKRMAETSLGAQVSREKLQRAATHLLEQWRVIGNQPPNFAQADGECFSLADMFQMLAEALGTFHRTGTLSESVRLIHLYGPLDMPLEQGPALGATTVGAVAKVCAQLSDGWKDETWRPLPRNVVPGWVTVDGTRMNAAQFLRLMAEAFSAPTPGKALNVKTSQMSSAAVGIFPTTRPGPETGATWTLKPARLKRPQ